MKREWKPGDVAMVRFGTSDWEVAIRQDDGTWACKHRHDVRGLNDVQARPLVVIDPEDREQVEAFAASYANSTARSLDWSRRQDIDRQQTVDEVQAALRSLIAPPQPDEPTGLGAVVEDDDGRRWVRTDQEEWTSAGDFAEWPTLDVRRVVSEGVTA